MEEGCVAQFNPLTTDDKCTRHATLAACNYYYYYYYYY